MSRRLERRGKEPEPKTSPFLVLAAMVLVGAVGWIGWDAWSGSEVEYDPQGVFGGP